VETFICNFFLEEGLFGLGGLESLLPEIKRMIHLTGHSYTAREVIQSIFSPLVGVVTSSLADEVCHRNNVSFVELLQPFAKLQNDAHFRDVSGTVVSVRGLRLNFCDVEWRPPQTILARKMLNESVNNAHNDRTKCVDLG